MTTLFTSRLRWTVVLGAGLWLAAGCKDAKVPAGPPAAADNLDYVGTWAAADSEGDRFDILVRADGTALTNWSKGETGARGERGTWTRDGERLVLTYDSGWTDILAPQAGAVRKTSFAPGAARDGAPSNEGPATRVVGPKAPFVGVWKTIALSDGSDFYIALKSDGSAARSVDPPARGTWTIESDAAVIRWNDGWVDRLSRTAGGYLDEVWKPGEPLTGPPSGKAPATPASDGPAAKP